MLAPLALVLAGCGAVSLDAVAKAADASAGQTSEHMEMTAKVTEGYQSVSMTGSGDSRTIRASAH